MPREHPEVVGVREVKDLLDEVHPVELGRISRWYRAARMPPEYARPSCSPVWAKADIIAFRDSGLRWDGEKAVLMDYGEGPLVSTNEIAAMVGVDKSQIARWLRSPSKSGPRFPEPFTEIAAGKLWDRKDILEFARARNQRRAA